MFIASLWKEIIMLSIFLIGLFLKHGLWVVIEKLKNFRGKGDKEHVELL